MARRPALLPTVSTRTHSDAYGYFAFPLIEEDLELDDYDAWESFANIVQAAKSGDFSVVPPLLELFDNDDGWSRSYAYVRLMGDAGTDALIERIYRDLLSDLPVDYCWLLSTVLFNWGRLDVVPLLAQAWRAGYEFQDAHYVPGRLSMLLEEEIESVLDDYPMSTSEPDANARADAYYNLVMARHAELVNQHGERAFVFRGRLLNVEWIARRGLADLTENNFDAEMRHKFEAMTGIDCTPFYDNGRLQPLAAAAILEAFLASPKRHAFVPGRRYFFGHPIPPGDPEGAAQWPPR